MNIILYIHSAYACTYDIKYYQGQEFNKMHHKRTACKLQREVADQISQMSVLQSFYTANHAVSRLLWKSTCRRSFGYPTLAPANFFSKASS